MSTADQAARRDAVDPSRNVVLEASAGTGKTRVLVERYVNLLRAGVEPEHILAITFTRKAAAEMRERIVERLREASRTSEIDRARWRELKERFGDIAISTIDAFCLSLLREFPLEADVDPGFDLAADTEVPRLIGESLTQTLRICRSVAKEDDNVALVFAQLGERRLRSGLASLIDRRLVAPEALRRYLARGPRQLTAESACRAAADRFRDVLTGVRGGLTSFLQDGPVRDPRFSMLADEIRALADPVALRLETRQGQAAFRAADRSPSRLLSDAGRPAARRKIRRHRLQRGRLCRRCGVEAAPAGSRRALARNRRRYPGVQARPQRHHVSRGLAHLRRRAVAVPPDAGVARSA